MCTSGAFPSVVLQEIWRFLLPWFRKAQFPAVKIFFDETLAIAFADFGDISKMAEVRVEVPSRWTPGAIITHMSPARMPSESRLKCPPDGDCLSYAIVASLCPEIWAKLKLTDIGHFDSSGPIQVQQFFVGLALRVLKRAEERMIAAGLDRRLKTWKAKVLA
jgi:hypothetical protein